MSDKVTLYIATHNKTNKKYFGKTTRYFTQEDLQKCYHGSGTYWKNHLKKHGDDVTMELYGIYSLNETDKDYVKPIALKFSIDHNVVEDYDNWANQINENGLGGNKGMQTLEAINNFKRSRNSKASKEKCAKSRLLAETKRIDTISTKGFKDKNRSALVRGAKKSNIKKSTKEFKEKHNGSNHYSTKIIEIYDHNNKLKFVSSGSFKDFCLVNNLPLQALKKSFSNNVKLYSTNRSKIVANKYNNLIFVGWYAKLK